MVALIPGPLAGLGLDAGGYYAMSPLENSIRLWAGLNALITPATTAGETYTELFTQLTGAATDGDSVHTTTLASWHGTTSKMAKSKFAGYTGWLHTHAGAAQTAAGHATAISTAQGTALATMPPPHVVVPAFQNLLVATVAASDPLVMMNPATAAAATTNLAAAEATWNTLRIQAGSSMTTYDATTAPILAALPPMTQPPSTVNGTAPQFVGGVPTSYNNTGTGLLTTGHPTTGTPNTGSPTTGSPTTGTPTTGTPTTGSPTSVGAPGGGTPGGGGSTPGTLPSGNFPASQSNLATPPLPEGVDRLDASFPGTSAGSAALAALASGLGMSGLGIGMFSGSAAELAGEATGFRMPSNWPGNTAIRTAAEVAAEEEARATAPRGAVAPPTGRRRSDEEERQRGSVPIDRPTEIDGEFAAPGVIEYVDDEA